MIDGLFILDDPIEIAILIVLACLFLASLLTIRQKRRRDQFFRPHYAR